MYRLGKKHITSPAFVLKTTKYGHSSAIEESTAFVGTNFSNPSESFPNMKNVPESGSKKPKVRIESENRFT